MWHHIQIHSRITINDHLSPRKINKTKHWIWYNLHISLHILHSIQGTTVYENSPAHFRVPCEFKIKTLNHKPFIGYSIQLKISISRNNFVCFCSIFSANCSFLLFIVRKCAIFSKKFSKYLPNSRFLVFEDFSCEYIPVNIS